jgi:enoyl-CoA hydratase/carnithine racemase
VASRGQDDDVVTLSVDALGIGIVTLNRPEKLNALNLAMFRRLQSVQRRIMADTSIRVVILTGAGRAFCSGLDIPSIVRDNPLAVRQHLAALLDRPPPAMIDEEEEDAGVMMMEGDTTETIQDDDAPTVAQARQAVAATTNLVQDVAYQWRQMPVPVIAALHGLCLGGGLQIALGADVRLLEAATGSCSILESQWGLIPDMTASVTLRELVRLDVAKEWTWTGQRVSGPEAVAGGLVTRCVEGSVQVAARALAEELVARSPDALRYAKALYQETWRTGVSEEYCLQLETQYQRKLLLSYNQVAASLRNWGWTWPYFRRRGGAS